MARSIELIIGFIGALLCAGVALLFGMAIASPDSTQWPLPGLVLFSVTAFGLLGLMAASREAGSAHPIWGYIPWTIAGALAALVVLGRLSIGAFLVLPTLCFLTVGIIGIERWETRISLALLTAALAAFVQSAALLLPIALSGLSKPGMW
jgi:hypothetical protein